MVRLPIFAVAVAFGLGLAGCGSGLGQSGSSLPSMESENVQTVSDRAAIAAHRPTGSQNATIAIQVFNALGSRVKDLGDDAGAAGFSADRHGSGSGNGACVAGTRFYSPDRAGAANSSEIVNYYDRRCSHVARDAVRVFNPGGSVETVTRTVSFYAPGRSASPVATRTESSVISNGTFDSNGYPSYTVGFERTTASQLMAGNQKQALSNSELVMLPSTTNVNAFCEDSAGFDVTGVPSLDVTFGWQGGSQASPPATRTTGSNGLVTWSSTQTGSAVVGAIGSLSIAHGGANTACPISTPAYTLSGGSVKGSYTIPIRITLSPASIVAVDVNKATFSDGLGLSVRTIRASQFDSTFGGDITYHATQAATFRVDRFGNGELTITSTGAQFAIVDWSVPN